MEPTKPVADNDVDTAVLDKLIDITGQQRQLDEFRTRAEAKKDTVDAAVYRRVVDDYKKRDAALDTEAQPLKAQARQEFEKLRAHFDTVNGRQERARYDKQELEFRHEIGEMDDTQLAERLEAPEAILEECGAELEALGRQKARFLEAFDEEELARPERDAASGPCELPVEATDVTMLSPMQDIGATDVTMLSPMQGIGAPAVAVQRPPAGAVPPLPVEADDEDPSDERTVVLPEGMLVGGDPDGGTDIEYRLSAVNYIGRSEDNQIRLLRDGVSRRHALIVADKTAFTIRDLRSQNGTFVNDQQVDECTLADGDIIKLGEVQMVFRGPKRGA